MKRMVTPEPRTTVSRRKFMSSEVTPSKPQPQLVTSHLQEPLPPAIINSLIVLLIKAFAAFQNRSPVQLLADWLNTPLTKFNPRPTHFKLPNLGDTVQPFSPTMVSMGYAVLPFEDAKVMGKGGEKFQQHVRTLKTHVLSCQPKGKYLYFELLGAYGRLYDYQVGRILGACLGLERSVTPCTLFLEDPILMDDKLEQLALLKKLTDYLRLRKLKTKIVAHFGINSQSAIEQIAGENAAHAVRLSLNTFQSLLQLGEGIKTAVSLDLDVILGDRHSSPELMAWLGILFQMRLLYTTSPFQATQASTEMYQASIELNRRAGNI